MKRKKTIKFIAAASLLFVLLICPESQAADLNNYIDFLWQADGYKPVWYEGKSLPVVQSQIKIAAIPYVNGKKIDSSGFTYDWFINFKKNIGASGKNKNSFSFQIASYDDYTITADIYNADKSVYIEQSITFNVSNFSPKIIFYAEDPLYGTLFNSALGAALTLIKENAAVRAEPYFFSDPGNLSYTWKMNGRQIQPSENTLLELQKPEEGTGTSDINLSIQNLSDILQFSQNSISINF